MDKEIKEKYLMIRVPQELKEKFYKKCKEEAINPSAWLRLQIEKFLQK